MIPRKVQAIIRSQDSVVASRHPSYRCRLLFPGKAGNYLSMNRISSQMVLSLGLKIPARKTPVELFDDLGGLRRCKNRSIVGCRPAVPRRQPWRSWTSRIKAMGCPVSDVYVVVTLALDREWLQSQAPVKGYSDTACVWCMAALQPHLAEVRRSATCHRK